MHTQIFAGTDSQYIDDFSYMKAPGADFKHEETLSIIFRAIHNATIPTPVSSDNNVQRTTQQAVRSLTTSNFQFDLYKGNGVGMVNGPTTFADNVCKIIATTLIYLIEQIANGHEVLNFLGHSRGAVISLMVAHELDRIKKGISAITTSDQLIELIIQATSENQTTGETTQFYLQRALLPDLRTIITPEKFDAIKRIFEGLKVNILALDPVPGNTVYGISEGNWVSNLYYTIPDIVEHWEQIIPDSERSCGFQGILPKRQGESLTLNDTILIIRGHHGSVCGNPGSQIPTQEELQQQPITQSVQHIVLYRIHRFLEKQGTRLHAIPNRGPSTEALNKYIQNPAERNTLRLQAYEEMYKHQDHFDSFLSTHYGTGLEDSVKKTFGYKTESYRVFRTPDGSSAFLYQMFPKQPGFINQEHVKRSIDALVAATEEPSMTSSLYSAPLDDNTDNYYSQLISVIRKIRETEPNSNIDRILLKDFSSIKKRIQALIGKILDNYLFGDIQIDDNVIEILKSIYQQQTACKNTNEEKKSTLEELKNDLERELIYGFFDGIQKSVERHLEHGLRYACLLVSEFEISQEAATFNSSVEALMQSGRELYIKNRSFANRLIELETIIPTQVLPLKTYIQRIQIHKHLPFLLARSLWEKIQIVPTIESDPFAVEVRRYMLMLQSEGTITTLRQQHSEKNEIIAQYSAELQTLRENAQQLELARKSLEDHLNESERLKEQQSSELQALRINVEQLELTRKSLEERLNESERLKEQEAQQSEININAVTRESSTQTNAEMNKLNIEHLRYPSDLVQKFALGWRFSLSSFAILALGAAAIALAFTVCIHLWSVLFCGVAGGIAVSAALTTWGFYRHREERAVQALINKSQELLQQSTDAHLHAYKHMEI